jgi:uncharacterized SAM-binding protein YcdF (DUF218 family)
MNRLAFRRGRFPTATTHTDAASSVTKSKAMRRRNSRKLWRHIGIPAAGVFLAVLLVAGFLGFAEKVATATPPPDPRADAIVVLTGGSARIDGALKLLGEGRATRLLISGVNPSVTAADLADLVDGDLRDKLACCVDLGRQAIDTVGNAAETRDWVAAHGFASLIVVTSDYHMARSMTELAAAMPTVALIPFPVSNRDLRFADWWRHPATFALLVREYGKFLIAKARQLLPGEPGAQDG